MPDRVLLTEKREQVLNGKYEGSESALRNQKSRLRRSASTALGELTQIAESPYVDLNDEIEAQQIGNFLRALLVPSGPNQTTTGGIVADPASIEDADDDLPIAQPTEEFQNYQDKLLVELARLVIDDPNEE